MTKSFAGFVVLSDMGVRRLLDSTGAERKERVESMLARMAGALDHADPVDLVLHRREVEESTLATCQGGCHTGAIFVPEVGPMGDEFCTTVEEARATGRHWVAVDEGGGTGSWMCPSCAEEHEDRERRKSEDYRSQRQWVAFAALERRISPEEARAKLAHLDFAQSNGDPCPDVRFTEYAPPSGTG